jgi:hypothetical protein
MDPGWVAAGQSSRETAVAAMKVQSETFEDQVSKSLVIRHSFRSGTLLQG